ncbi:MAG: tRNA pseudouridine(38-40) synthase TruA [Bacteroidaceae bacterium]|nr:tRNA pseudouridine(38-40) synthase TruA [Bacteroidaceae bacterium]
MRFFIYLSYDGARYHGWQRQPNGLSVQQVLEEALSTILRQPIEVVGAGRTDAGVNASMMVAHMDVPLCSDTVAAQKDRLNRLLPPDIAVQRIVPVRDDAHARFSATSRTYHYYITFDKSPFLRHYAWRCPFPLDIDRMNEAASHLFDYTDFTSFSKLHTDVKTNNCRIMKAEWLQQADGTWMFEVQADRFLRNMVRAIVGTLVDVGRDRMTVQQFCDIIERKDRCAAGQSMPGNALFLADITYPEDILL